MIEKPESAQEDVEPETHFDYFDPEGMFRAGGDYSYTKYSPRKLDSPDQTK